MKKLLFLYFIVFIGISQASNYKWFYNKDKTCSIYDTFEEKYKNVELFWTGKCSNGKAQGYGIAVFTAKVNGEIKKIFRYEGKIADGKYDGEALVIYPDHTIAIMIFKHSKPVKAYWKLGQTYIKRTYDENQNKTNEKKITDQAIIKKLQNWYKHTILKEHLPNCQAEEHLVKAKLFVRKRKSMCVVCYKELVKCYYNHKKYNKIVQLKIVDKLLQSDRYTNLISFEVIDSLYKVGKYKLVLNYIEKALDKDILKMDKVISHIKTLDFGNYNKQKNKILSSYKKQNDKLLCDFLFDAIRDSEANDIKTALQNGADVNCKDKKGQTPLILAGYYNNKEIVKLLLDAGADINAQDNDGSTALMNAAYKGNYKIVEYLLKKGASVKKKNQYDKTALIYAIDRDNIKIANLLLKKYKNKNFTIDIKEPFYQIKATNDYGNFSTIKRYIFKNNKYLGYKRYTTNKKLKEEKMLIDGKTYKHKTYDARGDLEKSWIEENNKVKDIVLVYSGTIKKIIEKQFYKNGIAYKSIQYNLRNRNLINREIFYNNDKNISKVIRYECDLKQKKCYKSSETMMKGNYITDILGSIDIKSIAYSKDGLIHRISKYDSNGKLISRIEPLKIDYNKYISKYLNNKLAIGFLWLKIEESLGIKTNEAHKILTSLVNKVKQQINIKNHYTPQEARKIMKTIGDTIKSFGFIYDYKHIDLFSHTLINKSMDCDLISILYVTIGEKLGFPIKAVHFPKHMAVIWQNKNYKFYWEATGHYESNIELYNKDWNITYGLKTGMYGEGLSKKSLLTHVLNLLVKIKGEPIIYKLFDQYKTPCYIPMHPPSDIKELLENDKCRIKLYGNNDTYMKFVIGGKIANYVIVLGKNKETIELSKKAIKLLKNIKISKSVFESEKLTTELYLKKGYVLSILGKCKEAKRLFKKAKYYDSEIVNRNIPYINEALRMCK